MSAPERATLLFLNVDLDVESPEDLTPLIEAMEPQAYSLQRSPGKASFESNEAFPNGPEVVILEFIRIIKSLPPVARKVWDGASKRVFDIGMQSGRHPFLVSYNLGIETLREAADVKAEIAITMYALDPADDDQ